MAIYHLSAKIIGRAAGRSAVAAAAYRHGARMEIDHDGRVVDYTRKIGVEAGGLELPEGAPAWAVERYGGADLTAASSRLWNDVEAKEATTTRHATAVLAREYEISLPVELTPEQNLALARGFIRDHLASRGMIADWAFHNIDGNPHVHVMVTMRHLGPEGFGLKNRDWNQKAMLAEIRAAWAETANRALEQAGHEVRIDHRSFADQGIELEPQSKIGPVATAYERNGATLDVAARHREIEARNAAFLAENPEYFLRLVTAQRAVFTEDDLAREIHKRVDDAAFTPLFEKLRASDELVKVGVRRWGPGADQAKPLLTTRSQLAMEQGLLDRADDMARQAVQGAALLPEHEIANESLSEEQRVAVSAMVSPSRLSIVTGYAGAGKSLAVSEARRIWEERGFEVFGAALAGKAVDELAKSSGVEARTIASWEQRMITGAFTASPKFVMVLDEAGMIGSREMDRFMRRVEAAGGKLVLIGDAQQLQPIASGAALRAVAERVGDATISTIRRQHDPEHREIAMALATSAPQAEIALHRLDKRGEIIAHADDGAAARAIASKMAALDPVVSSVALAYTNADVAMLNRAIRREMVAAGRVRREGMEIERVSPAPSSPNKYSIESTYETITFAPGERVITTRSLPEAGISKGAFGEIEAVTPTGIAIRFDSTGERTILPSEALKSLDYGYAVTIHKSQGATVDRAYVLPSDHMDRQVSYVALTRHRSGVEIHMPLDRFEGVSDLASVLSKTRLQTFSAKEDAPRADLPGFGVDARLAHEARRDLTPRAARDVRASIFTDPHLHEVSERGMGLLAAGGGNVDGGAGGAALSEDAAERLKWPGAYVDGLIAAQSVFSAEELSAAILADAPDPETYLRAFSEAAADPRLVILTDVAPGQTERLYSTTARVRDEMRMGDLAVRLASNGFSGMAEHRATHFLRHLGQTLSDQQRVAAEHALSGQQRLAAITGVAGAGKSYMMGTVREVAERMNFAVRGIALAGKAAASLEEGSGIPSQTIAAFLAGQERGETLKPHTILVMDEAGMVDAATMTRVMEVVEAARCKLVLVGDAEQLQPIGPGGAYRGIVERIGHVELTEVRRQKEPWMAEATQGLAKATEADLGAKAAIDTYHREGRIRHCADRDAAHRLIVKNHEVLAAEGVDQVILAYRRADVDALNQAVLAARAETRQPLNYHAAGGEIGVAVGDRIQLTRNFARRGLRNGDVGTVVSTKENGFVLQFGSGEDARVAAIMPDEYDAFAHGFATTIHKSQGTTVDFTHLYADRSMNKHLLYVGMSRHRYDLRVVTPEGEGGQAILRNMASKARHQALSIDHITDANKTFRQVLGSRAVDDLARDLRVSDVKAAMAAARQDPVTQEKAQAARLTQTSRNLMGEIAGVVASGGLGLMLQGDAHATRAVAMFRQASRIAATLEDAARLVGAPIPRNAKQDAVADRVSALRDDLAHRIARAEIAAGKDYGPARHAAIREEVDWITAPATLTPAQDDAAWRLSRALRRQEDIAGRAAKMMADQGYQVDAVTQEHRRLALSFTEERMTGFTAPTILDRRMAERMVELIAARDAEKIDETTFAAAVDRLEQVRAAVYLHPQFEAENVHVRDATPVSDQQFRKTLAVMRDADPMVRARAIHGDPGAVRIVNPELSQREAETLGHQLRTGMFDEVRAKDTLRVYPEVAQIFREKARLGMPVADMTPAQASAALRRLQDRYGRGGVEALAKAGRLDHDGVFGLRAGLGPAHIVKPEMKALLAKAKQHRKIARTLELILKPVRELSRGITR